ncbi:MAG: 2-oxoacid:acceptor oxidoreductase family protein [Rhodobacteraceae bacterium]|nr:2-oxoacid:acceptor oxidoreductase family protein [Paracoccaceae bacterium]
MREILILGRGGQGAQTAGNLLARAFFEQGSFVQTFATYGGARRGTPVTASLRVDDQPIRQRSNIEHASAMLCFDESLLEPGFLGFARPDTVIVVNTHKPASAFAGLGDYQFFPIDGRSIAQRNDMGKVVNSALLGAFAAKLDQLDIDIVCNVIQDTAPAKKDQNVAACRDAYAMVRNQDAGGQQ